MCVAVTVLPALLVFWYGDHVRKTAHVYAGTLAMCWLLCAREQSSLSMRRPLACCSDNLGKPGISLPADRLQQVSCWSLSDHGPRTPSGPQDSTPRELARVSELTRGRPRQAGRQPLRGLDAGGVRGAGAADARPRRGAPAPVRQRARRAPARARAAAGDAAGRGGLARHAGRQPRQGPGRLRQLLGAGSAEAFSFAVYVQPTRRCRHVVQEDCQSSGIAGNSASNTRERGLLILCGRSAHILRNGVQALNQQTQTTHTRRGCPPRRRLARWHRWRQPTTGRPASSCCCQSRTCSTAPGTMATPPAWEGAGTGQRCWGAKLLLLALVDLHQLYGKCPVRLLHMH